MTWETCLKQAANCRKNGDEAGALMYEQRAERKKNRDASYYQMQADACAKRGDTAGMLKWQEIAEKKKLEVKVPESKAGKKKEG